MGVNNRHNNNMNYRQAVSRAFKNDVDAHRVCVVNESSDPVPVTITNSADNYEFDAADGDVSAIKAIYKTINGIAYADKDTSYATATVIGVSITGNTSGNMVKYIHDGKLEDSSFNFPLNDPLYLGNSGEITNTVPVTGNRTRIGTSLGTGAIDIQIEEPIIL